MKKSLFSILIFVSTVSLAQTNTFPNDGNVGIGTTSPTSKLHIAGDGEIIKLQDIFHENTEDEFMGWLAGYDKSGDEIWWIGEGSGNNKVLGFYTNRPGYDLNIFNKEKGMVIKDNGSVGIGTSNPDNVQGWHGAVDVHGLEHSKILATSNTAGVKTGIFSHGANWNGVVGRLGTESNHDLRLMAGYGKDQFTLTTNGNVGIGTTSPSQKLEIVNPTAFNVNMENQGQDHISIVSNDPGNGGFYGGITWMSSDRRRAAIAATREHTDADYVGLAFFTQGTDGPGPMAESMRITRYGKVGIGTSNPDAKLTVKGGIHAEEVKVDLSVPAPDYVFKKGYDLLTIEEVQNHITQKGHLPNIPSATQMEKEGIELGVMNMKLLEKIEELTLYTIAQEKQLKKQEQKNKELEARLEKIEAQLKR